MPVYGMDCAECAAKVRDNVARLPGVVDVNVLLSAERATITFDTSLLQPGDIRQAVRASGYEVGGEETTESQSSALAQQTALLARRGTTLFAAIAGVVILIVVLGEWLGLLEAAQALVPWTVSVAVVLAGGYPVFRQVMRDLLNRQISSHFLMTMGTLAALSIGEYATAAIVVLFMRVGSSIEGFTMTRARSALRDLYALSPQQATLWQDGREQTVPVEEVTAGDMVIVRAGQRIPVDGLVVDGHAAVDQAAITGESMPVDVGVGEQVYAASLALNGALRVETAHSGRETTFSRLVRMIEEAEAHPAPVQRFADRFTAYYVPIVAGISLLTWLIGGAVIPAVAVLVVACSCSIALATPVAVLASTGAAAKSGVLLKGGRYIEVLAKADTLLIDKTGTLTLGKPDVIEIVPLNGLTQQAVLQLAASAEHYSTHPLATAVRNAASGRGLATGLPDTFQQIAGQGVRAGIDGHDVYTGKPEWVASETQTILPQAEINRLREAGQTVLLVARDGESAGLVGLSDTLRPEVPAALDRLRGMGFTHIELLTGDHASAAADVAGKLSVPFRAGLLPEDKIEIVQTLQAGGKRVVMIGDGINDGPALAQADVGIAIGHAGADVAMQVAHVTLLREDWNLIPMTVHLARRTMNIVRGNLIFTAIYNVLGIGLAAVGILPPGLAAAAQSLPDLGVMGNTSRLLRRGEG